MESEKIRIPVSRCFNLKLGLTVLKDGFFKSISVTHPARS